MSTMHIVNNLPLTADARTQNHANMALTCLEGLLEVATQPTNYNLDELTLHVERHHDGFWLEVRREGFIQVTEFIQDNTPWQEVYLQTGALVSELVAEWSRWQDAISSRWS